METANSSLFTANTRSSSHRNMITVINRKLKEMGLGLEEEGKRKQYIVHSKN